MSRSDEIADLLSSFREANQIVADSRRLFWLHHFSRQAHPLSDDEERVWSILCSSLEFRIQKHFIEEISRLIKQKQLKLQSLKGWPGCYTDQNGGLHIDLTEILEANGYQDNEQNRRMLVETWREMAKIDGIPISIIDEPIQ